MPIPPLPPEALAAVESSPVLTGILSLWATVHALDMGFKYMRRRNGSSPDVKMAAVAKELTATLKDMQTTSQANYADLCRRQEAQATALGTQDKTLERIERHQEKTLDRLRRASA